MIPALQRRISRREDLERNALAALSTDGSEARSHSTNVMFVLACAALTSLMTAAAALALRPLK